LKVRYLLLLKKVSIRAIAAHLTKLVAPLLARLRYVLARDYAPQVKYSYCDRHQTEVDAAAKLHSDEQNVDTGSRQRRHVDCGETGRGEGPKAKINNVDEIELAVFDTPVVDEES